jgi:signal transduction histidine kinase/response regulator of citrate/malate metabolism
MQGSTSLPAMIGTSQADQGSIPLKSVLIIEDSESDRMVYQRYLAKVLPANSKVLACDNGGAVLSLVQTTPLDLILLDYRLPDMDGLEVLEALKQQDNPLPPIIMLIGQGNETVAVQAMKQGVVDYLIKEELTLELFTRTLHRVFTQQHMQAMLHKHEVQQILMAEVSQRISQSLNLTDILTAAVEGLRQLLKCDRTLVYRFETDMSGTVIAESVSPPWSVSLGLPIRDTCFQTAGAERYLQGHRTVLDDIYNSDLTQCHIELLEQFEVKANLVVPILLERGHRPTVEKPRLWGLLIAHQCASTRHWDGMNLTSLNDLAVKLAIAIQQSELVSRLKRELKKRQTAEVALQNRAQQLEHLNQTLTKTTRLLQARNQELDDFAYIASHDLKAPLRAISNLSQWLEEDLADSLPEDNRQQLELLRSRVIRMESLIEGVLQYSRLGRQEINQQSINTTTVLKEVLASLAIPETFTVTLPEQAYKIETDPLLLERVLSNLISNAIKYHHRSDGHLQIQICDRSQQLEFAVRDDGPGIDPAFHQQIFGLFQTLQSRDQVESTGIGLTIVKKIVERQGGDIWLESQLGQGTTFRFTWPKA